MVKAGKGVPDSARTDIYNIFNCIIKDTLE
jgi:hypothetical protein